MLREKEFLKIRLNMITGYVALEHELTEEEYAKLNLYEGYLQQIDYITRMVERKRLYEIVHYGNEAQILEEYKRDINTLPRYGNLMSATTLFNNDYIRPLLPTLGHAIIREFHYLTSTCDIKNFDDLPLKSEQLELCMDAVDELWIKCGDKFEYYINYEVKRRLRNANIPIIERPAPDAIQPVIAPVFRAGKEPNLPEPLPFKKAGSKEMPIDPAFPLNPAKPKPIIITKSEPMPPATSIKELIAQTEEIIKSVLGDKYIPNPASEPPIKTNETQAGVERIMTAEEAKTAPIISRASLYTKKPVVVTPTIDEKPFISPPSKVPTTEPKHKTVSEFAQENNITVQTVYRYISRGLKEGYILTTEQKNKRGQNVKYITKDGEKIIKEYFM